MCECPDRVAVIRPHRVAWEWECGRSGEMCQSECLRRGQHIAELEATLAAKDARLDAAERLLSWIREIVEEHGDFVDALATYHAKYAEKGEVKNG